MTFNGNALTQRIPDRQYDKTNERYGEPPAPDQEYRDIRDIERILNLPDQAPHRGIDKIVQAANDIPYVKTVSFAFTH